MEDVSHPFRVYCDASIDGFNATLKQEQPDGSVRPTAYVSHGTLVSERHALDLKAGSIVWAIERLRGYLFKYEILHFLGSQGSGNIGNVRDHNARVQRWLEYLVAFNYTLEYRKGIANGNADFLSRLLQPATEHDLSASPLSTMRPHTSSGFAACSPPFTVPRHWFRWAGAPTR